MTTQPYLQCFYLAFILSKAVFLYYFAVTHVGLFSLCVVHVYILSSAVKWCVSCNLGLLNKGELFKSISLTS